MTSPNPDFRDIAKAEQSFASLVRGFVSQYRPDQQPFVTRVCKIWAGAWVNSAPGLTPAPGQSIEALEDEIYRARWRRYYVANRERILQRQRRRQQWQRRGGGPH